MDLVKMIADKAVELAENGTLEQIVTKHVTECIDDVVKDCFKWSGEGKKSLEAAIKSKLDLPLEVINVSRYQKIISNLIEVHLNNTAVESAKTDIIKSIEKVTAVMETKEVTLKEIIEKYIEGIDTSYHGGMDDQIGELSFIVDDESTVGDFVRIYFDKESGKDKYQCENQIGLHDGKIFTAQFENTPFSPFTIDPHSKFEAYLFQLYANNCKVDISDYYKIETTYYREDFD